MLCLVVVSMSVPWVIRSRQVLSILDAAIVPLLVLRVFKMALSWMRVGLKGRWVTKLGLGVFCSTALPEHHGLLAAQFPSAIVTAWQDRLT